ncbi:alkylhydroperoxidase [bacterium]|nr:MAG: alkylhydroperoxidase [bacterium]
MHEERISRFGTPADLTALPDDVWATIEKNSAKLGFVPNVFLAYAKRPEHFRAFMHYHDVLMRGESGLSRAEREMIVVAVSGENDCLYCVVAHGAALRILSKRPLLADQVATNWQTADLSAREREMLSFATALNRQGSTVDDGRLARLHDAGFSDDDIWDIAAIAGFFGFSNRMASTMDMRPNAEFYTLGR